MGSLISDVLDFARGSLGGGLTVARVSHDALGAALSLIVDEVRVANPKRTILSSIVIDGPVVCEPARIAQLLSNLLANAIVHGLNSSPVSVVARCESGLFRLAVTSGGARAADGHPTQGLGLGLYIAAEIAKAHGGRIEVTSDNDETQFALVMPDGIGTLVDTKVYA